MAGIGGSTSDRFCQAVRKGALNDVVVMCMRFAPADRQNSLRQLECHFALAARCEERLTNDAAPLPTWRQRFTFLIGISYDADSHRQKLPSTLAAADDRHGPSIWHGRRVCNRKSIGEHIAGQTGLRRR